MVASRAVRPRDQKKDINKTPTLVTLLSPQHDPNCGTQGELPGQQKNAFWQPMI
jgi:hypothetical protein